MSNVYIVLEGNDYEASYVVGVFSKLADAETFAQQCKHGDYHRVEEHAVWDREEPLK